MIMFNFDKYNLRATSMDASARHVYYKQNRLKQLSAFCYAAQSESISQTAERKFLSQPAGQAVH